MRQSIPKVGHRITLEHDSSLDGTPAGFEQGQEHNRQIISFAREVGGTARTVMIEVFYNRSDGNSSTEENYDAVAVNTTLGEVLGTIDPYTLIDSEWEAKRNG